MMTERTSSSTEGGGVPPSRQRLQKVMARAGVASRRRAEEMIAAGRVSVNGESVTELGTLVDPALDDIVVDGQPLATDVAPAHLAVYKPTGYLTSASDPFGRKTVMGLVKSGAAGLFPVGRLDLDSEGLLLVMNEGELAHRLTHPSYHVEKEYEVVVAGHPDAGDLTRLRGGVDLEDGATRPAEVAVVEERDDTATLRVVLKEGRKRQLRRMCEAVGHPVESLVRVRFGPVWLGEMRPGDVRDLEAGEVLALRRATGLEG
jgi:pseudouridine synthase